MRLAIRPSRSLPIAASRLLLAALLSLVALGPAAQPAAAAGGTFTVNTNADDHDASPGDGTCATSGSACSLRAALEEAYALSDPGDVYDINIPAMTISLNAGLGGLVMQSAVVINGAGMGSTIISGGDVTNILVVQNVTPGQEIHGVTMRDGTDGALINYSTLLLERVELTENATGGGGGAITNVGDLTLDHCVVTNNSAAGGGGAISSYFVDPKDLSVTVLDSTLSGNSAGDTGGAIYTGETSGCGEPPGSCANTLTIQRSTLSGNAAGTGGAVKATGATKIINSTISENSATVGAPAVNVSGSDASLIMGAVTISGNSGPGLGAGAVSTAANVYAELAWTILAANTPRNCDLYSTTQRGSHNLESANTCRFTTYGSDNLVNTDPLLQPLGWNGGPTMTHLPGEGSPAIDSIPVPPYSVGGVMLDHDQRGYPRPLDGDRSGASACDRGAVEVTPWQVFLPLVLRNFGASG